MKAPRRLETARLLLVAPTIADAEEMFERYAGDAEVTTYMGWRRHESVADTRAFVEFCESAWERWPAGPYLIRSRADGLLLGSTGLGFTKPDEASTGYVLAKDSWGRGYATEALRAMVDLSRQIQLRRVYACCHPEHRPSAHVLEKCGFMPDPDATSRMEFPNLAPGVHQETLHYHLVLDRK